jgi:hypothetical protein
VRIPPLAAAFFALLGACSPDPAQPVPGNDQAARTAPAAPQAEANPPRASGEMQREGLAAEGPEPPLPAATRGERRCGWLSNPTPGNWWLFDGHGEWILSVQGGPQAPGFEELPDMTTAGWVETNGHYGYGCACMTISFDPATRRVTRVADARPKPLKQCRADKGLPRP